MNTFFTIEMLQRSFLGFRQFKPAYAHTSEDVACYAMAVDEIFGELARRDPGDLLTTPPAHAGFFQLTRE